MYVVTVEMTFDSEETFNEWVDEQHGNPPFSLMVMDERTEEE